MFFRYWNIAAYFSFAKCVDDVWSCKRITRRIWCDTQRGEIGISVIGKLGGAATVLIPVRQYNKMIGKSAKFSQ